jgi:SAM-dependent methyltransferase
MGRVRGTSRADSRQDGESFEARYLSGRCLYGDDFASAELDTWFDDEREGYADLGPGGDDSGSEYGYHELNRYHGFRYLPGQLRFEHALGVGSARADEFDPIAERIKRVTVLEPSDQLVGGPLATGVVPSYVKPSQTGIMPWTDETFDLVLCFGTLHHIPNVSTVLGEIGRVTRTNGWVLIREPVISMGDWRSPRKPGVTKRERGIPQRLLASMVQDAGLRIEQMHWCGFPMTPRLGAGLGLAAFNSSALTVLDDVASRVTRPLYRYHADATWKKVRPTSAFLVCCKR